MAKLASEVDEPQSSGLLPASDRIRGAVLAFLGARSQPFVLGAIGLVTIALLALAIRLGWHGPGEIEGKAHAAPLAPVGSAAVTAATAHAVTAAHSSDRYVPDNHSVSKPNSGGEFLLAARGKTSAHNSVELASQLDMVASKKNEADYKKIGPQSGLSSDESASAEPPSIPASVAGQSPLNGVSPRKFPCLGYLFRCRE